jgi:hypothetical protein
MLRILATGTTGTIGKHFSRVIPLSINLLGDLNSIEQSLFKESSASASTSAVTKP